MFEFVKKVFGKRKAGIDLAVAVKSEALPENTPEVSEEERVDEGPGIRSWIGVDLDGTLAQYHDWRGLDHVGDPIPVMLARVKYWLEQGYTIKIFTARASEGDAGILPVKKWLATHGLPDLEVTNVKDFAMIELWDDRAIQVVANTGKPFLSPSVFGRPSAPILPNEKCGETFYLLKNRNCPPVEKKE